MLQNLQAGVTDPELLGPPPTELFSILPGYLLVIFAYMVLLAAYESACLRWMIRSQAPGLFGLTLSADTWRVWFVYWGWFVGFIVLYIAVLIATVVILGAAAMLGLGGQYLGLITIALIVAMYASFIYFAVRTGPAAATTIAQGRFSFFDSWKVSKGRFWALFGSYFLIGVLGIVALLAIEIGAFVTIFTAAGYAMGSVFHAADAQSVGDVLTAVFSSPQTWAIGAGFYLLLLVVAFGLYVGMFGVNARAAVAAIEEGKITPHDWGKE